MFDFSLKISALSPESTWAMVKISLIPFSFSRFSVPFAISWDSLLKTSGNTKGRNTIIHLQLSNPCNNVKSVRPKWPVGMLRYVFVHLFTLLLKMLRKWSKSIALYCERHKAVVLYLERYFCIFRWLSTMHKDTTQAFRSVATFVSIDANSRLE